MCPARCLSEHSGEWCTPSNRCQAAPARQGENPASARVSKPRGGTSRSLGLNTTATNMPAGAIQAWVCPNQRQRRQAQGWHPPSARAQNCRHLHGHRCQPVKGGPRAAPLRTGPGMAPTINPIPALSQHCRHQHGYRCQARRARDREISPKGGTSQFFEHSTTGNTMATGAGQACSCSMRVNSCWRCLPPGSRSTKVPGANLTSPAHPVPGGADQHQPDLDMHHCYQIIYGLTTPVGFCQA